MGILCAWMASQKKMRRRETQTDWGDEQMNKKIQCHHHPRRHPMHYNILSEIPFCLFLFPFVFGLLQCFIKSENFHSCLDCRLFCVGYIVCMVVVLFNKWIFYPFYILNNKRIEVSKTQNLHVNDWVLGSEKNMLKFSQKNFSSFSLLLLIIITITGPTVKIFLLVVRFDFPLCLLFFLARAYESKFRTFWKFFSFKM